MSFQCAFEGWPTAATDEPGSPFCYGYLSLNHPVLADLGHPVLEIPRARIDELPTLISQEAAALLDGRQFGARIATSHDVVVCSLSSDDGYWETGSPLPYWYIPALCAPAERFIIEAFNDMGSLAITLAESRFDQVFNQETLERLRRAIAEP